MKGICLTIAAVFMISVAVSAKGEASNQPGAPTGYPDSKRITPIKVTYDDIEAQNKAEEDPLYIKERKVDTWYMAQVNDRKIYIDYYTKMGDDGMQRNLNFGNNAILSPIQGSIR